MAQSYLNIYMQKLRDRVVPLYLLSVLAFIALLTVTRVGLILHERGVAIPQEMAVGAIFFAWLPTLKTWFASVAYLLALIGGWLGVKILRRGSTSTGLCLCLISSSLALGEVLALTRSGWFAQLTNLVGLLALGVALMRAWTRAHSETLDQARRALSELSLSERLHDIPLLSGTAALGWVALFLIEMFSYTSHFTPRLISPQSFSSFIIYGFAVVALSAMIVTSSFLLSLLLIKRAGPTLQRFCRISPATVGSLSFAAPHLLIFAITARLFRGAVGQEIDGLDLNLHLLTLLITLSLALGAAHLRSFAWVYIRTHCERRFFSSYLTSLIALPLTLILAWRDRSEGARERLEDNPQARSVERLSGVKRSGLVVASSLIILYPLMRLTFPNIEDMTAAGGSIFGVSISAIVLIIAWSLVSPRLGAQLLDKRRVAALTSLLVGSLMIIIPMSKSQELRVISDQYMKVFTGLFDRAHFTLNTPWNFGFDGPGKASWSPYETSHERFAPHPEYPLRDPKETPIVLILWDAGRPDRMSVYGYERPTTPHLDDLRDDFFIFDEAISAGTATSIGTKALFSGHYSTRYMLEQEHVDPFWTQELLMHGYRDFILNVFGTDYNGISLEAFRRYLPETYRQLGQYTFVDGDHSSQRKLDQLCAQLRAQAKRGNQRYLLSMHLVDTHSPWRFHDTGPRFGESLSDRYDHNVAYSDQITGALFEEMKRLGVWDQALVILLADHGTGLNEHGRYAGFRPYQEQIKVPLLIKLPRRSGGVVISEPVSLIDIGPTITHLFEEGTENRFDGVSLLPLMLSRGRAKLARRHLMSLNAFNDSYAVIEEGRWKWILYRRERYLQLFDLQNDPQELHNLADLPRHQRRVSDFKEMMRSFLDRGRETYNAPWHYYSYDPETFRY